LSRSTPASYSASAIASTRSQTYCTSARGVRPQLTPDLIEAAWNTLFVAS